jgi:acetyl esterase/lipase
MRREILLRFAEQYTNGLADPLLAPLDADLSGLPPVLVQVAAIDTLRHDGKALAERLTAAGVEASLEVYDASAHAFQLFWSFYPEAARAVSSLAEFLQGLVVGSAATYEEA